jgi:CPA2 family monovalent cation:H+ antiporter-2
MPSQGLAPRSDRATRLPGAGSRNSASMGQLAEFGVVFLLFAIGLELSWERL